jgi:hypothetical protein
MPSVPLRVSGPVRDVAPRLVPLALVLAAGCSGGRGMAPDVLVEPRFVAVHNALAAMGLAQVGPLATGRLAEGAEARVALDLPGGCPTLVAIAGDGVRDLDATLIDPGGKPLARDATSEPQAVLRPCLDAPGVYTLVVKAAAGGGPWVAGAWIGGLGSGPGASPSAGEPKGTCEAPIPLSPGAVTGSTSRGASEHAGSCAASESKEEVYVLEVAHRQRVTIEVTARFDSVLYLRKDDCADADAEVACNDDAQDRSRSAIDRVLDPGRYFVFVDGYGQESGTFEMTVTATDVVPLADACRAAPELVAGAPRSGTTQAHPDDARATCGGGAEGADAPWRIDVAVRERVRVIERSGEMSPVVHLRTACTDDRSEITCADSDAASGEAVVARTLDPGSYVVFADAHGPGAAGAYELSMDSSPETGAGVAADGCGDAAPLGPGASGVEAGDTFAARDDVSSSCAAEGGADVVYRLDLARRSRLVASLGDEEAPHVLALWNRCGDRRAELACGRSLEETLAPGTYFVGVDAASAGAFGRFTLRWWLRDLSGQPASCAAAPVLREGRTVDGSTAGAPDDFTAACAGTEPGAAGPDRAYRLALRRRGLVRITATSPAFDPVVSLRRVCVETPTDPAIAELACEADVGTGRQVVLERPLEAGDYWVVVDGQTPADRGAFTLRYEVAR